MTAVICSTRHPASVIIPNPAEDGSYEPDDDDVVVAAAEDGPNAVSAVRNVLAAAALFAREDGRARLPPPLDSVVVVDFTLDLDDDDEIDVEDR